jgi:hypothetical protein
MTPKKFLVGVTGLVADVFVSVAVIALPTFVQVLRAVLIEGLPMT